MLTLSGMDHAASRRFGGPRMKSPGSVSTGKPTEKCIETRVAAREAKTVECKRAGKHGEKVNTTSLRQSHDAFRDVDTERRKMVAKVA